MDSDLDSTSDEWSDCAPRLQQYCAAQFARVNSEPNADQRVAALQNLRCSLYTFALRGCGCEEYVAASSLGLREGEWPSKLAYEGGDYVRVDIFDYDKNDSYFDIVENLKQTVACRDLFCVGYITMQKELLVLSDDFYWAALSDED